MPRMWHDEQLSLEPIRDQTIAVIGYGIQGAAQASNMRDSGLKVIVGLRKGGRSWEVAAKAGHRVMEVSEAAKAADVWRWIVPPESVDVIMLAPKAPGQRVRELYLQNFGTPALVAVHRDASGGAWNRILGIAKATGCARAGIIETTFKEEVETDWFGEQADLCGGVDRLVRTAFETLVEAGYQPEIAYFECLHELKLIVDLIQKYGIAGMYRRVSETARYGGLTRGGKVISAEVKKSMRRTLDDIQKGNFAKEWVEAYQREGQRAFEKYLGELDKHQIEQVGRKLRSMMWPREAVS
ncbi:MAG: ketol-acid reductoisomerase [Thaumarchaeota archaeon]|nr:MAG: ketol-acid reductoisomerase [Nitrososphaerota archaeon]